MSAAAITRVAMTTAVGPDARTSAAAFRAGISRARELAHFAALDEEDTDVGPIAGHVAVPLALHAEGLGKMVALGADVLRGLLGTSDGPDRRRTGLYLAVPNYSLREESFVDVNQPVPAARHHAGLDEEDEDEPPKRSIAFAAECRDHLVDRLTRAARVDFAPVASGLNFGDGCAFLKALDEAMTALASGAADRCIVGGIDSYLDVPSLEWGMLRRRLKSESNPVGFAPGEAAVFLELALPESGDAGVGTYVSKPGFGEEPGQVPGSTEEPPRGEGLAQAIGAVLAGHDRPVGLVIADLNGEPHRAMDWGYALIRAGSEHPGLRTARVWAPAESFGETGCASPGLAIGVAAEALHRGYARADSILVLASSDTGDRAATIVSRSPARG